MKIPPSYTITSSILDLIAKIDANREVIARIDPPPHIVEQIHRVSVLKSSLFSARIEGNRLTMEDIELSEEEQEQIEIRNILTALTHITAQVSQGKRLTKRFFLKVHALTMQQLRADAGRFRTEMNAIFNQAGVAIYVAPGPAHIDPYMQQLCTFVNGTKEQFPLVRACIAHLIFEKIHPFMDGNGRVGRLLMYAVLQAQGYSFGIHVPVEEYLDAHKDAYYYHIDQGMKDTNAYLQFMLEAYHHQTERIKQTIEDELHYKKNILLPPRQQEIYSIVRDQRMVSFDTIRRRFLRVPERTLRYDLKKLLDAGLIQKVGKTKGAYYTEKK